MAAAGAGGVPVVAAVAGPGPGPPHVPMILSRLNERAPILATGADAKEIVTHRLRMRLVCEEHGITPYVCGPLPAGATLENIALGKRFYLSGFEDESLRAVKGGNARGRGCRAAAA